MQAQTPSLEIASHMLARHGNVTRPSDLEAAIHVVVATGDYLSIDGKTMEISHGVSDSVCPTANRERNSAAEKYGITDVLDLT